MADIIQINQEPTRVIAVGWQGPQGTPGSNTDVYNAAEAGVTYGATDQSVNMQAAIDAAWAAKKTLHLPSNSGTDAIRATNLLLPGPMHIKGAFSNFNSTNATILRVPVGAGATAMFKPLNTSTAVNATIFENIVFLGNGEDSNVDEWAYIGQTAFSNRGIVFRNCFFRNFGRGAVKISDAFNIKFESCYFFNCGDKVNFANNSGAVWFENITFSSSNACTGVTFIDCYWGSNNIGVGCPAGQRLMSSSFIGVNIFENNQWGVRAPLSRELNLYGAYFEANYLGSVYAQTANMDFCYINYNGPTDVSGTIYNDAPTVTNLQERKNDGTVTTTGATPTYNFIENDQTSPAGRFRLRGSSGAFGIRRNTAVAGDFSTEVTDLSISSTGNITTSGSVSSTKFVATDATEGFRVNSGAPAIVLNENDQTLPAGLFQLKVSAGEFSIRRNKAVGGDFSTEHRIFQVDSNGQITFNLSEWTPTVGKPFGIEITSNDARDNITGPYGGLVKIKTTNSAYNGGPILEIETTGTDTSFSNNEHIALLNKSGGPVELMMIAQTSTQSSSGDNAVKSKGKWVIGAQPSDSAPYLYINERASDNTGFFNDLVRFYERDDATNLGLIKAYGRGIQVDPASDGNGDAVDADVFLELKAPNSGRKPFVKLSTSDANAWVIQHSNTTNNLDFNYNGTPAARIWKEGYITSQLIAAPTNGRYYFGNIGGKYLGFDGTNFTFNGGSLNGLTAIGTITFNTALPSISTAAADVGLVIDNTTATTGRAYRLSSKGATGALEIRDSTAGAVRASFDSTGLLTLNNGLTVTGTTNVGAITISGAATTGSINGQTISSAASLTGTLAVAGTSTFTGMTTHSAGITIPANQFITGAFNGVTSHAAIKSSAGNDTFFSIMPPVATSGTANLRMMSVNSLTDTNFHQMQIRQSDNVMRFQLGTMTAGVASDLTGGSWSFRGAFSGTVYATIPTATSPSATSDLTRKDYVDAQVATKANLASPTFTGTVTTSNLTVNAQLLQINSSSTNCGFDLNNSTPTTGRRWYVTSNGTTGNYTIYDQTAGLTRMTIDSAGLVNMSGAVTIGGTLGVTGALTAPSLSVTGTSAPTTGVYAPTAGDVGISTAGSRRVRVDANGIITTGNAYQLPAAVSGTLTTPASVVDATTPSISFNSFFNSTASQWQATRTAYGALFRGDNAGNWIFYTQGNTAGAGNLVTNRTVLTIADAGNVTIANPASGVGLTVSGGGASITGATTIGSLGTGTVYSNSGVLTNTDPSDERLKTDIVTYERGLAEIEALRPVTYKWQQDTASQGTQFGFIAQEVQAVIPEAISTFDREGQEYFGLDKNAVNAALVNAVKELSAKCEALAARVAQLEQANAPS